MPALLTDHAICPFCFAGVAAPSDRLATCSDCGRPFLAVALHRHESRGSTTGLSLPDGARPSSAEHETIDAGTTAITEAPARDDLQLGRGRYACSEELGRGGMGVVVRAKDRSLNREVAIKLLKEPERPGRLRRFLREAQVSGQLAHPNIVPVHDFGIDAAGRVYFTMQLIEGRTLAQHLDDLRAGREGMPLGHLVRILVQVCNAIELAHSRDVIHRDLKPGNIMIGSFGEVLVMDWGLARVLDGGGVTLDGSSSQTPSHDSGEAELTIEGTVLGTPAYMPPEQAEGRHTALDARSDIYSLGAILYELLTLRAPVVGRDLHDVLLQVRSGSIPAPSQVAPAGRQVPRDLEAVALHALAHDPAKRYRKTAELRRDLEAWLDGRAVSTRTVPLGELAVMAYRRHRVALLVAMGVIAAALGGLSLSVQANRSARFTAEASRNEAEAARAQSEQALHEAQEARAAAGKALAAERDQRDHADRERYLASIALASQEVSQADYAAAVDALAGCPENLRDWPWRRLDLLTRLDLLRRQDSPEAGTSLAPLAGGRLIATGRDGFVRIYADGLRPEGNFAAHRAAATAATLLTDGKVLTGGGDGTVRVWRVSAEEPEKVLVGAAGPVIAVAGDEHLIWSLTVGGRAVLWDRASGAQLQVVELGAGARLLREDGRIVLRRLDGTGAVLARDAARPVPAPVAEAQVLAWSPTGYAVAKGLLISSVGSDGKITALGAVPSEPSSADWSADGHRLVVVAGSFACVFAAGQPPLRLAGHAGPLAGAAFLEDGARLATLGEDGTLRLWDAERRRDIDLVAGVASTAAAASTADGSRVLLASADGKAALIDVRSRSVLRRWSAGFPVSAAALSADGALAALAGTEGHARVWQVDSGYALVSPPKTKAGARALAFDASGGRLAIAATDGRVRVHDLTDGHEVYTCHGHAGAVIAVAFGADRVRTGGVDGTVRTFAARNGERLATDSSHEQAITALAFTRDESQQATARGRLLELAAPGDEKPRIAVHLPRPVRALCFSEGGTRLFAATDDGAVRCLDTGTGRTLLTARELPSPAVALAVAGDRDLIALLADGSAAMLPASR